MPTTKIISGCFLLVLAILRAPAPAAVFYLDGVTGVDTNPGDQTRPWKTLDKVSNTVFLAGDQIRLQGGQIFDGFLYFDTNDAGTKVNPIIINSYGTGRAGIRSGSEKGIQCYNTAGFSIKNLNIAGNGSANNSAAGILFYNDLPGNSKLEYIRIDSVDVSGYGDHGILLRGANGLSGYRDVRITNVVSHHNRWSGIFCYGVETSAGYAHEEVYVGNAVAHNNSGWDSLASMGGIVLSNVDSGTIENSIAYNNSSGSLYTGSNGPVGIWAYNASNITIQFNESHHNGSGAGGDGGGFDLDWGISNSVMQYNYSHDNDGAGFLVCEIFTLKPLANAVVRYNISQNDSRRTGYGVIQIYNGGFGVSNIEVHNNTVFLNAATVPPKAFLINTPTSNVRIRNNLFITSGNAALAEVSSAQTGLVLQNNNYYSLDGTFAIKWNGVIYNSFISWRSASGQESGTGYSIDPLLNAAGAAGTLNQPSLLNTLTQYYLKPGSPMIEAGSNLAASGLDPGTRDFFGNTVPYGSGYDIGVHEYASARIRDDHFPENRSAGAGTQRIFVRKIIPHAAGISYVINYFTSIGSDANIGVYDTKGRLASRILADTRPGAHVISWNATDNCGKILSNGVYFLVLRDGRKSFSRKFVLVK